MCSVRGGFNASDSAPGTSAQSQSFQCNICQRIFKNTGGLKCHITRIHKGYTIETDSENSSFLEKITTFKNSFPVIRRIPRGARIQVAQSVSNSIDKILTDNSSQSWQNFLTISYKILNINKSSKKSVTHQIKENCSKISPQPQPINFQPISMIRKIARKISEGDLKAASRLLFSNDSPATNLTETLDLLRQKHPPPSRTVVMPEPPSSDIIPLTISEDNVRNSILSFPSGSSSGIDGFSPQHLKDLIHPLTGESGNTLLIKITSLCNHMLAGKVPPEITKILYGAKLHALSKKEGGIRPIAIGSVFRRLVSKLCCKFLNEDLGNYFRPLQLGFGSKGGAEAAVHATRTFIHDQSPDILVKIDIKNAFNSLERDIMLKSLKDFSPELYPYIFQCYSSSSSLFFEKHELLSQVGCQQGDPLGPALFSLSIQNIISDLKSKFNLWYLDDGTLAGSVTDVTHDLQHLINRFQHFGLELNFKKCELLIINPNLSVNSIEPLFSNITPGIKVITENNLTILGVPVFEEALPKFVEDKLSQMNNASEILFELPSHLAYQILKYCFYAPKFIYMSRCSLIWKFPSLYYTLDHKFKKIVETIFNTKFSEVSWSQATLPICLGGLGLRTINQVSLPAFLSSCFSTTDLIGNIINPSQQSDFKVIGLEEALDTWNVTSLQSPIPSKAISQKSWDHILSTLQYKKLLSESESDPIVHSRLLASATKESGAWLGVLPSPSLGTFLDNQTFNICAGIRIGAKVCEPHTCVCGSDVDASGLHGLCCLYSAGRRSRHSQINDIIRRTLATVSIPAKLEPTGLCRDDGKRPDGMSLIPWKGGRALVWDATCADTFASSHLPGSTRMAGAAANNAEEGKVSKYREIANDYIFLPFAVETMGPWGGEARRFVADIKPLLRNATGDPRSCYFFIQRISLAIQRGNAASILGTMPAQILDEYFLL